MPKKRITIADIVRILGECEIQDERGIWLPLKPEDYEEESSQTHQNKQKTCSST